jgi:hypothetical protein
VDVCGIISLVFGGLGLAMTGGPLLWADTIVLLGITALILAIVGLCVGSSRAGSVVCSGIGLALALVVLAIGISAAQRLNEVREMLRNIPGRFDDW